MKIIFSILVLIFVLGVCFIPCAYQYHKKHYCDNPYEQICVKSHKETKMMPVPYRVGKFSSIRMQPRVITICEEYETVLKEKCKELENETSL